MVTILKLANNLQLPFLEDAYLELFKVYLRLFRGTWIYDAEILGELKMTFTQVKRQLIGTLNGQSHAVYAVYQEACITESVNSCTFYQSYVHRGSIHLILNLYEMRSQQSNIVKYYYFFYF